ncbi:MAG: T9SS type A sorting domain-containing protein [Bacteroidota bacterium]|nr:T9SS type A sorting domain-containing protein [Bacteroidota bacterium]
MVDFDRNYPQIWQNGQMSYLNQGTGGTESVLFQYTSIETNVITLTQQAETLKGLMVELTTAIDSGYTTSTIIDDFYVITDAMNELTEANDSLINTVTDNRIDQVDDIDDDNSTIFATETIASNEQLINEIYFSTISRDIYEFTSQQISVLLSIAVQCPMSGGNSVMNARALYALVDPDKHYNDRDLCMLDGILLRQTASTTNKRKCIVFPNPANNYATLSYQLENDSPGVLEIFNHVGQKLSRYNLNANETNFIFSIVDITPGVYYLRIQQDNNVIDNLKFVIIR